MKPFWQRPPKKTKKKKRKPKAAPQSNALKLLPKSKPAPWVPPHPIIPKAPSIEDMAKPPMTYRILPASMEDEKLIQPSLPTEQKVFRHRDEHIRKDFLKTFRSLTNRWRSWDIWTDFITMAACTISNSVDKLHFDEREKTYLRIIKKYSKQEQEIFPQLFAYVVAALEENPEQDFLGDIYTELGLNSKEHEQIFTPYNICHFMAEITIDDLAAQVETKGVVEIHDCCCGAGAILIAASNVAKEKLKKTNFNYQNHILITGQDIDYLVTMMCYIQLSLLGMAGYFKVGNALTDPMTDNDSLENYWFTPMYFFPVWHYRRVWHSIGGLLGGEPNAEVHEN